MWNLVMQYNLHQAPFYDGGDAEGTDTEYLMNGGYYDYPGEDVFMSGITPFEAPSRYSKKLRNLIRHFLRYLQSERPTIEEVKERAKKGLNGTTSSRAVSFKVSRAFHSFRLGDMWLAEPKQRQGEESGESD
jgi:hypothetical protein